MISIVVPLRPAGTPASVRNCHCDWAAKYAVTAETAKLCQYATVKSMGAFGLSARRAKSNPRRQSRILWKARLLKSRRQSGQEVWQASACDDAMRVA